LAGIMAPALRQLRIGGPFSQSAFGSGSLQHFERQIGSPSFIISGEAVAGITSLTIITEKRVRWEFYSLSALKELELTEARESVVMVWASDALEAILMRPCDLPVLEKIKLTGECFEWDILLLMLERRILYSHLGISHINTLVLPHDLLYKLLHPIAELLQGKLPEREANEQFSLTAVGQRLWDNDMCVEIKHSAPRLTSLPLSPGCFSCCYAFRNCDALTIAGVEFEDTHPCDVTILALGYELPSEYLTAYPPLTLEVAKWLSGKPIRRRGFVRNKENSARKFYRERHCGLWSYGRAPVAITGHLLDGERTSKLLFQPLIMSRGLL
jgi:hypothetical protein